MSFTFDTMLSKNTPSIDNTTNDNETDRLALIDDLKLFLATAATEWNQDNANRPLKQFHLPTGDSISCVLWQGFYLMTGTDIVRSLNFRFHAFGRPITNVKKFEEGIFSDLRNLKPGLDARLEDPKSDLLEMLYKNDCIRTQKKQKVFFWYSVPHDRLFLDALERDLKREKLGLVPATTAMAEPALSTCLNTTQVLLDQLRKSATLALENEDSMSTQDIKSSPKSPCLIDHQSHQPIMTRTPSRSRPDPLIKGGSPHTRRSRVRSAPVLFGHHDTTSSHHYHSLSHSSQHQKKQQQQQQQRPRKNGYNALHSNIVMDVDNAKKTKTLFGTLALFDGSPTYKQRRRRAASASSTMGVESNRRHVDCHLRTAPSSGQPHKAIRKTVHTSTSQSSICQQNHPVDIQQPPLSDLGMNSTWITMMDDTSFVALAENGTTTIPFPSSDHELQEQYEMDTGSEEQPSYDIASNSLLSSSLYSPPLTINTGTENDTFGNMDMEISNVSCQLYKQQTHSLFASPDLVRLPYSASPGTLLWTASDEGGGLSPSSPSSSSTSPSSILHYQNYHDTHPPTYTDDSLLLLPLVPTDQPPCLAQNNYLHHHHYYDDHQYQPHIMPACYPPIYHHSTTNQLY